MTPPSSSSSLSLIPLSTLPDETKKPANPHLALVGPVSAAIGKPLFAFSEVDQLGYEISTLGKKSSPAQHWMKAIKPALAIGVVFGGLLGLIVVLVSQSTEAIAFAVGLVVVLTALFTFLFRPKRKGFTAVVGTDGMDVGVIDDDKLTKAVVRYDDDEYLFFEYGTNIFTRRPGSPKPTTPTTTQMALFVRDRASLELRAIMNFVWTFRDRVEGIAPGHRPGLYFALVESGYPRRIARARARLERGEPVELPVLGGRVVRILPSPGVAGMPWAVELARGGSRELRVAQLELQQGRYTVKGDGKTDIIGRQEVGDAFVLDALVIAPTGAAMSAEGENDE